MTVERVPERIPYFVGDLHDRIAMLEQKLHMVEIENAALRQLLLRDGVDPAARVWLTVDETAEICCKTPAAVRAWCRTKGIALPSARGYKDIKSNLVEYLRERGLKVPEVLLRD